MSSILMSTFVAGACAACAVDGFILGHRYIATFNAFGSVLNLVGVYLLI